MVSDGPSLDRAVSFGPPDAQVLIAERRTGQVVFALCITGATAATVAATSGPARLMLGVAGTLAATLALVVEVRGQGLDQWVAAVFRFTVSRLGELLARQQPAKHGRWGSDDGAVVQFHLGNFPLADEHTQDQRVAMMQELFVLASSPDHPGQILIETVTRSPLTRSSTLHLSGDPEQVVALQRLLGACAVAESAPKLSRGSKRTRTRRSHWTYLSGDGLRRVLWVDGWPQRAVTPGFLTPLLTCPSWEQLAITFVTEPRDRALQRIERAQVAALADGELRRRGGFRRTAAIAQRSARRDDFEAALVRGATPIRFTGLIVIGADTLDDLNTRTASAQVAAQRAGCSLSILRGVQREAMAAIGQPLRGSR